MKTLSILIVICVSTLSIAVAQDQQQRLTKVAEQLDAEGLQIHADAADKVADMMLQTSTAIPTYGYLGRKIEDLIVSCKNTLAKKSCTSEECNQIEKLKEEICKLILDKKLN